MTKEMFQTTCLADGFTIDGTEYTDEHCELTLARYHFLCHSTCSYIGG
jgi:hypothetical protein